MADCPHGAHIDHENRIRQCESGIIAVKNEIREVKMMQRDPRIVIATIGAVSGVFSGTMAFLAVILAPIIKSYLGL